MVNEYSLLLTIGTVVFLLVLFLFALYASRQVPIEERNLILKQLDEIKYSMALHNVSANRDGIVRLDSLLSKSLQLKHRNSLNCGENLKKSKYILSKDLYEDIWYFHKLRNQIVHENIELTNEEAVKGYSVYSRAINKLIK